MTIFGGNVEIFFRKRVKKGR